MASNLVRKQITDKNGVSSTRWVKPESAGSSSSKMPLPSVFPSSKAEAKRIGKEIREYLNETDFSNRSHSWSHNDYGHFRVLIEEGNDVALRIVQRLLLTDSPHTPGHVGYMLRRLARQGHENPEALMSEESLDARESLVDALNEYGAGQGIPYFSEREGSEEVALMAFTDLEDAPRIADIIAERGVLAPEEIRTILSGMDGHIVPLQKGVL